MHDNYSIIHMYHFHKDYKFIYLIVDTSVYHTGTIPYQGQVFESQTENKRIINTSPAI